jgi:hypothetical protein
MVYKAKDVALLWVELRRRLLAAMQYQLKRACEQGDKAMAW